MDTDEIPQAAERVGVRLGHRVSIKKLEKIGPGGRKIRTHPRYSWRCSYVENGNRATKYFKTKAEAEEWAKTREVEALAHGTDSSLTAAERSIVIETRATLAELGLTLRDAVNFLVDHQRRVRRSGTVAQLAASVVATRTRAGLSDRHLRDLEGKLKRFSKTFGPRSVATITRKEIEDWLYSLKLAPASLNSYRRILVVAFNDAKRNGHLDRNPAELVRQAKVVETEVGILTPQEAAALLAGADEAIRPAIALGLFAGLRVSELEQIDWGEVHLDAGHVRIAAGKAKSARNRIIPISENLAAWLKLSKKASGSVWPASHQQGRKMMEAAHRAAGFGSTGEVRKNEEKVKKLLANGDKSAANKVPNLRKWPDNGLRHSYATYHLALHANAAELALHLGHTNTALIFAHYRKPVTKEEASLYWTITPENAKELGKIDSGKGESK
jgi:integrase